MGNYVQNANETIRDVRQGGGLYGRRRTSYTKS
jgi:hypothetical protein